MKVLFKRLKTVNVQQKQCQNSFNSILFEEDSMSDVYEDIDEKEDEDSDDEYNSFYIYSIVLFVFFSFFNMLLLFLFCIISRVW